ncbi:MAG TPA: zf-HC2 domain-containing protein [Candidatus Krumholzibacteria bacterium]|nr:zf-HC2 domain-containing protein [Candidatus Krumholzibacteria bacterium]
MTTHESILAQLDDYIDGLLEPAAEHELNVHLASCPACSSELRSLRELLNQARQLRTEIQPSRDLWPELAARLEDAADAEGAPLRGLSRLRPAERSIPSLFSPRSVSWLLAAVLALVLLLPPTLRGLRPPSMPEQGGAKNMLTLCSDSMVEDYRVVLVKDDGKLSADAVIVLNRSLDQIQAALRETVTAMGETNLNSPEYRSLAEGYRNKLNLLQRIAVQTNTL